MGPCIQTLMNRLFPKSKSKSKSKEKKKKMTTTAVIHNHRVSSLHDLPLHIFEDILLRLPPKTLFQCTCVSKLWYSLIKHPFFAKHLSLKHQQQSQCHPKLIFSCLRHVYSLDYEASVPEVVQIQHSSDIIKERDDRGYVPGIVIWGYSNGFLCITSIGTGTVFFWNPYTRQHKRIPDTPKQPRLPDMYWMHMLGYHAATQDYILVRVSSNNAYKKCSTLDQSPSQFEVYSSTKDSWTTLPDIPYVVDYATFGRFIGASFYWAAQQNSRLVILSYHVETRKVDEVTLPDHVDPGFDRITVASLDGHLCAVFHYDANQRNEPRHKCEGWIFKSCDGARESWTKLYCFLDYNAVPLSFVNNATQLLLMNDTSVLYLYEIDNRRARKLEIQKFPPSLMGATVYTESVVTLCSS